MSNQQDNPHRNPQSLPKWPDLESALRDLAFVRALTRRCARLSRDPEQVAGATLLILCVFAAAYRYDPCRGSVMALALGIARRVAANTHRRQAKQKTGFPDEPSIDDTGVLNHLIVREQLDLVLAQIRAFPTADQDLLWRGAHCRYCDEYPPMTGTERARLYRLRKKLAKVINYPY